MLIAVASKDGKEIDQHFGHAERFLIYDVENGDVRYLEEIKVERYCSFNPEHPLRGHLLRRITDVLSECRAVVTSQIGDHPKTELEKQGVEAFVISGPIETTLVELVKIL